MTNRSYLAQLLKQSYFLYKENFIPFFQLSAAQAILGLISSQVTNALGQNLMPVSVIISLVILYFQMRFAIALVYLVKDRLEDKTSELIEYFNRSKEKIWQYIGASFLVGLTIAVPLIILGVIFMSSGNNVVQAIVVFIAVLTTFYLLTHYFLTPYIVLLNPNTTSAFNESYNLVKPVWITGLLVIILTILMLAVPFILFDLFIVQGFLGTLIGSFIQALVAPLNVGVIVLFYFSLTSSQDED